MEPYYREPYFEFFQKKFFESNFCPPFIKDSIKETLENSEKKVHKSCLKSIFSQIIPVLYSQKKNGENIQKTTFGAYVRVLFVL